MKRFLSLILLLPFLMACNRQAKTDKEGIITVSIEPQRYFTESLVHGYYHINCMVPSGNSPETYDPTPRQLVNLGKSVVYLRIGYIGFEQMWIGKLKSNTPHLKIYETFQGVNFILDSGHFDLEDGHATNRIEPHIWCSSKNADIIAANTYNAISSIDKKHNKIYKARYDLLQKKIASVDSVIRVLLSKPSADKAFAIYHPSLSYFARDYGLRQIAIERNGKEPSTSELESIIHCCKAMHVHVVFVQPEFDRRNAEIIARQIGARVISIDPLNRQWDKEMIAIAQALSEN